MVKMNQRARDFYSDYLNLKIYQEMLEAALEHDLRDKDLSAEKMKEICKGKLLGRYAEDAFDDFMEILMNENEVMSSYIEKANQLVADFMAFADKMNNFPKRSLTEKLCEETVLKMGIYAFLLTTYYRSGLHSSFIADLRTLDDGELAETIEDIAQRMFGYITFFGEDEECDKDENFYDKYAFCTVLHEDGRKSIRPVFVK